MDPTSPMMNSNMLMSGSGSRKRPYSLVNSLLTAGISNDNSDDFSILSSFGMKDRDIFKSPVNNNLLIKQDMESTENFKVPINATTGQSPYFQPSANSSKKPAIQEIQEKCEFKEPKTPKFQTNNDPQSEHIQLPNPNQEKPASNNNEKVEESFEIKPRKLRPIGEYSVSSLDKEYQEIMQYLKEERERDQQLFAKCSRSLRDRTESIIEGLENLIKIRYQTLDENLHSVISGFEKEWEVGKNLEEEFIALRTQMSAIINNILQDPSI